MHQSGESQAGGTDEFDEYLARRRRGRKLALAVAIATVIALVAVPYALSDAGLISGSVAAIFYVIDLFILAGTVRAFALYLNDRTGRLF